MIFEKGRDRATRLVMLFHAQRESLNSPQHEPGIERRENRPGAVLNKGDPARVVFIIQHDRAASYGSNDWQLLYSADTQKVASQGSVVTWPAGTHEAWGGTSPAWTLEAAIPWSALGSNAAAPGRVVGFDLKLDDNDSGTTRDRDLVLFYNATNSSGGCSMPNCRTDAFGAVQLQGR